MTRFGFVATLCAFGLVLGCGDKVEEPFMKPTVKVKGKITINGAEPGSPVQVVARSTQVDDEKHPTASTAETLPDGTFEISTYNSGDGVPEGKYVLVATWQELNLFTKELGPDKLKGKYDAMNESPKEFEAKAGGEPIDLGTIELKAPGAKK
jgi:hypothetical protein